LINTNNYYAIGYKRFFYVSLKYHR